MNMNIKRFSNAESFLERAEAYLKKQEIINNIMLGDEFCSLFTDLANPISNSIYMKMGYKPVCDMDEYKFSLR